MENRKISLVLTTYNRPELTLEAFKEIIDDPRLSEIVIVDDCSEKSNYEALLKNVLALNSTKIRVYRNDKNLEVYSNKMKAVSLATNEYVIQGDSDNIYGKEYLDAIYTQEWQPNIILAPTFAKPTFDYRAFNGVLLYSGNAKAYINMPMFNVFLNTMNYMVNRDAYIKAWEEKPGIVGADSIYFNYLWLKKGGKIKAVENMAYQHRIHSGNHYTVEADSNTIKCDWVRGLIANFPVDKESENTLSTVKEKFSTEPPPPIQNSTIMILSAMARDFGVPVISGDNESTLKTRLMPKMNESLFYAKINEYRNNPELVGIMNKPGEPRKNFVTCALMGRLANQLFQIAVSQSLALDNGVDFLMPSIANVNQAPSFPHFPQLTSADSISGEYEEKSHGYTPINFLPNMKLVGFFQSHKYFWHNREKILPMFKLNIVRREGEIGLHQRLGDFVELSKTKHVLISEDYIRRSIQYFRDRGYTKFNVYSDEIGKTKSFLQSDEFKDLEIVFSEGRTPIQDMEHLAGNDHIICSASTYSYWGAYLALWKNENSICICPDKLWVGNHTHLESPDSYPPNAIKMPN